MQQLKKSENSDPNKLVSFIPSLTNHIKSFLPYVIDKENYDAVKYEGDTFFAGKKHEDYGNFLLAVNEFSNGKVEEALKRMDFVTKNHPKFKGAHHLRIVILAKLSAHKEYHADYRNALIDSLKAFPEDHDMKALLANHQIDKEGEKEKALECFEMADKLEPQNSNILSSAIWFLSITSPCETNELNKLLLKSKIA